MKISTVVIVLLWLTALAMSMQADADRKLIVELERRVDALSLKVEGE